jgi:hypothetical protein
MARLVTGGVLAVLALAGCGAPPELRDASRVPPRTLTPTPTDASASPTPLPPTLPVAATSASSDAVATDCQGRPSGAAIVALIRRSDLLPDGVQVTVEKPPVCAGSWQYTVLQVPGHEPLQVVSKGKPGSLTLVTAGTDVCSIPVRTGAPPGIRTLAC